LVVFEFQLQTSFAIYIEERKQIVDESGVSNTKCSVDAETEHNRIIGSFLVGFPTRLFSQAERWEGTVKMPQSLNEELAP
jgi:hypothetical protein